MTNEKMTVHEALSELKMLDKRISAKIDTNTFCYAIRHNMSKINGMAIDDVKKSIKSVYESITDLIARRAAIRNALSQSNASTKITIGDKEYSVAEAIEMKKSGIDLKQQLLAQISVNYNDAVNKIEYNNGDRLTQAADNYVNGLYGSKEKSQSEEIKQMREAYIQQNTYELVDPLGLSEKIADLSKEIDEFISKVDSRLSVSNAITEIEINY